MSWINCNRRTSRNGMILINKNPSLKFFIIRTVLNFFRQDLGDILLTFFVLYSHMQIHIYIYTQHHNDTINKQTSEDFFTKYIPLTLFVTFERVIQGLRVRGSWRPNRNCNILTSTLMAVNVVSFSFSRSSTGGPAAQLSAGWWLSLLHLINNFSGPQLNRRRWAPSADLAFLTTLSSITPSVL